MFTLWDGFIMLLGVLIFLAGFVWGILFSASSEVKKENKKVECQNEE